MLLAAAELKDIAALGQIAVSLAIGGAVGYVAYQQWKTARDKLRLDLYDRRFKVFQAVMDFIGHASSTDATSVQEIIKFDTARTEALFLFGGDKELLDYLASIRAKSEEAHTAHAIAQGIPGPPNAQRTELTQRILKAKEWLFDQPNVAKEKFARYLSFP